MAQMFPSPLPAWVREDPRRAAECHVYDLLERELPDKCCVFYGVAWLVKKRHRRAQDGEIDFILVHPEKGIVVIEVKGGRISRDGRSGEWFSQELLDAERVHPISDPVNQVRRNKYALREKLAEVPAWEDRRVDLAHAVVFPDCAETTKALAPDLPREITLFANDLPRIRTRLDLVFQYWANRTGTVTNLDSSAMEVLKSILAPSFDLQAEALRPSLGLTFCHDEERILRLTEEQFHLLDCLARNRRVEIGGGAGTGKTLLALEKAKRLAREGFRTLLTCFNRPLADFLGQSAGRSENLEVLSFHQFCFAEARRAGIPLIEAPTRQFFEVDMPAALDQSLERLPHERFDALVVDEGQDFKDSWWIPLQHALEDPADGVLYIFYDDNQRLYRRAASFPAGLVPFRLTRNLRNTQTIHAIANKFYGGGNLVAAGPNGRPVEFLEAENPQGVVRHAKRVMRRLIGDERISPADIAVLTGKAREQSEFFRLGRIGEFLLTDNQNRELDKILLESIYRFKGLERPIIVLAEIDDLPRKSHAELLYVGITRARVHLAVIGGPVTLSELRKPNP